MSLISYFSTCVLITMAMTHPANLAGKIPLILINRKTSYFVLIKFGHFFKHLYFRIFIKQKSINIKILILWSLYGQKEPTSISKISLLNFSCYRNSRKRSRHLWLHHRHPQTMERESSKGNPITFDTCALRDHPPLVHASSLLRVRGVCPGHENYATYAYGYERLVGCGIQVIFIDILILYLKKLLTSLINKVRSTIKWNSWVEPDLDR